MAWQRYKINLEDYDLNKLERQAVGEDVLIHIQNKAINENKGYNDSTKRYKKFPRYTKDYAGKKGSSVSNVNLILSSDMFNDMKVLSNRKEGVLIGFVNGTKSNGKAEGNQKGTYGQSSPIAGKARPFLGITKKDLDTIVKRIKISGDDTDI